MSAYLRARIASFRCAFRGVGVMVREQTHARLHTLATALVAILGLILDISAADWKILVLTIGLVWLAEGLNTALEYLADAAVPQQHPLVGKAKDVAAGAVLLGAIAALILAGLIFIPYL